MRTAKETAKDRFRDLQNEGTDLYESNDCAVIAVAAVLNKSYREVHTVMKANGRRNRKGTPWGISWRTLKHFGFKAVPVKKPVGCKTMTSAPRALRRAGYGKKNLLIAIRRHVAAFVDGEVQDWSQGRRHHIRSIWEIVPINEMEMKPVAPKPIRRKCITPKPVAPKPRPKPIYVAPEGIKSLKHTRAYLAGGLVREHGLAAGVTDMMVQQLDFLYGKANARESRCALVNAWHALRAFTNSDNLNM